MQQLEPVIWNKGTFLSPQYLQQQDRFLEDSLRFHVRALEFRPWGFTSLRIDQEALAGGVVRLVEASGMLADGLLFDMPRSDSLPPPKTIAGHLDAGRERAVVFLAIPSYRDNAFNVAVTGRETDVRYRGDVEMMRDENTGQSEKPVVVARKNFRLLFDDESREGSSVLPVAEIRRAQTGLCEINSDFVPPLLDFRASDHLVSMTRRILEILSARSTALAGARRQKNQSLAEFTAADIAGFWLLYTINTAFPVFRHLFETRGGHPEALYSAMLSLAGSLTAFSQNIQTRDLPAYDHDNLGRCFTSLDDKLRLLLETVIPSNFVSLPLKLAQPSIYVASINRDEYFSNTRMYLAVRSDANKADIIRKVPRLVKISSIDSIEHLVQSALPGVPLAHLGSPPPAIPVKLDYQYFSLSQSGGPWESIGRARNLAVYVPTDFPNPQLELLILLPQAG